MYGIDHLTLEHLEGLSTQGVVWVELVDGTKHTVRKWDYYIEKQQRHKGSTVDLAVKTLRKGRGLGYLVHGDIWVLDLDTVTGAPPHASGEDRHKARVVTNNSGTHAQNHRSQK